MSVQKYPCADCNDVILIGERQGICDYKTEQRKKPEDLIVVEIFEINTKCPKPEVKNER